MTNVILSAYARVASPIILDYFSPACCIAATAITIKVFAALGYRLIPLVCRVSIFNAPFVRKVKAAGRFPEGDEVRQWTADGESWSVGIGHPGGPTGFSGHLVALFESASDYIIDASLSQANRPAKNITLPPVMVQCIPYRFLRREEKMSLETPAGTVVIYEALPSDHTWEKSPDWTDSSRHDEPVNKILGRILTEMERKSFKAATMML